MIFSYDKKPYWQDINILQINRLKPRAFFLPFKNSLKAKSNALPHLSDTITMLDGEWECRYFKSAMTIKEEDFVSEENYKKTTVPSCWQADGLESPAYVNVAFPIQGDTPNVPYENPCVIYRRDFYIKKEETCLLTFMGVSSAFSVYVNGKFVGYSEGSHNCSEFDVTTFVEDGQNTIVVLCFKWCNGSYFECQDMFRNNGIFRSVFLTHLPESYVYDISIKPKTDREKGGKVYVNLTVVGNARVKLAVEDADGRIINEKSEVEGNTQLVHSVISIDKPKLWSAEIPNLYYLVITVNSGDKQRVIRQPFGFKTVEIKKGVFLFNGKPIKIFGVNHHDTHPDRLFALNQDDIEKDISLMKKINVNAVRFSHYPPHPYMLELCDKEGLYVIDEADAECHGELFTRGGKNSFSNDPIWKQTLWDRVERLFERDKNHASVIMWSLGNESGAGKNHVYAYKNLKKKIFASIIHYEDTHVFDGMVSDVKSFMYSAPDFLKDFISKSEVPVFLCEYAHSMGVGPGGVKEYLDLFLSEDRMIGGCVWEWAEHAVRQNGQFKYGGENGEYVHDGNFCVDGMLSPDRELTPSAYEIMNAYRPIRSKIINKAISFKSNYVFKKSTIKVVLTLLCNGLPTGQVEEVVRFEAGKEKVLPIPSWQIKGECFLNVDYYEDGERIGFEQHPFSKEKWCKTPVNLTKINFSESDSDIIVHGDIATVTFDKVTNTVSSITAFGEEFINQEPKINRYIAYSDYLKGFTYNLYRYGIDNDMYIVHEWDKYRLSDIWNNVLSREIVRKEDCIVITVKSAVSAPKVSKTFDGEIVYTLYSNGSVGIQSTITPAYEGITDIPRFGLKFEMPEAFTKVRYYGYGERENYADFLESARIGVYSCKINGLSYDYIKPQEGGERTGVRWFEMLNEEKGVALEISSDNDFLSFHATQYNVKDFIAVKHNYDLEKKQTVCVSVDGFFSGVGSNSCGPLPFDKYRIKVDEPKTFSFLVTPKKI